MRRGQGDVDGISIACYRDDPDEAKETTSFIRNGNLELLVKYFDTN